LVKISDQLVKKQKSYAILNDRLETFDRYCSNKMRIILGPIVLESRVQDKNVIKPSKIHPYKAASMGINVTGCLHKGAEFDFQAFLSYKRGFRTLV
jgi:hypothetical protein